MDGTKQRIEALFRFLAELHNVRRKPPMTLDAHPWLLDLAELPEHPSIRLRQVPDLEEESDHSFHLEVLRATVRQCPRPPASIEPRLEPGWDDPLEKAVLKLPPDAEGTPEDQEMYPPLTEDELQALHSWYRQRDAWVEENEAAARSRRVFQKLVGLWSVLQREAESYELLLADGVLTALDGDQRQFRHPILFQSVELDFDPDKPCFTITEGDQLPRLYTALLRQAAGIDGQDINAGQTLLDLASPRIAVAKDVETLLRQLVQRLYPTDGVFLDRTRSPSARPPFVEAGPHLLLVKKIPGYAEAVERFLEVLGDLERIPTGLTRVVDRISDADDSWVDGGADRSGSAPRSVPRPEDEPLLTKPANDDQTAVIQRLSRSGTVLVQGPPGTGKTHTIANLIGHLLAQGKSILVTSHSTKALRVLREHVVPELRDLCVSVLESDRQGRQQLEQAVNGIVYRLNREDPRTLDREIAKTGRERDNLKKAIATSDEELRRACQAQSQPIVLEGRSYSPVNAARKLDEEQDLHGWVPDRLPEDAALPLSPAEIRELYASNGRLSADVERKLGGWLPDPNALPAPDDLADLLREQSETLTPAGGRASGVWNETAPDEDQLRSAIESVRAAARKLRAFETWQLEVVEATIKGQGFVAPYQDVLDQTEQLVGQSESAAAVIRGRAPVFPDGEELGLHLGACREIVAHLESGGSLGFVALVWRGQWKNLISSCQVMGRAPSTLEDFRVLQAAFELAQARRKLVEAWDRVIGSVAGPSSKDVGSEPEQYFFALTGRIREALGWYEEPWSKAAAEMAKVGLGWEEMLPVPQEGAGLPFQVARLAHVCSSCEEALDERLRLTIKLRLQRKLDTTLRALRPPRGKKDISALSSAMSDALANRNETGYRAAYDRLVQLSSQKRLLDRRQELLGRLATAAPSWAKRVAKRSPPHDATDPPGDPAVAWHYRLLEGALLRRLELDADAIQRKRSELRTRLYEVNREYIAARAWRNQQARTNPEAMSALTAWTDTIRKLGKGTGKRAPKLKAAARQQLDRCRETVPVWIMPMNRVIETYDLAKTRFDVVIVDEASQLDVLGLLAFAFGEQIIVVGDNEQVSPPAVAQSLDQVQALIDQYLPGIPNHQLYDGRTSIYDIARQRFGGRIRLREHFRCAREIIEFSNNLCYDGEITPLRDTSRSALKPPVVLHRVNGCRNRKINEVEVRETAGLVAAAIKHPAYQGKTIGVISMVGQDQADAIDTFLAQHVDYPDRTERRLVCGTPAQFQGDERDIVFISMVDAPADGGPLPKQERPDYKQRLNVAASRARDQLWVISSLDPALHLKNGDLRKRFLDYVADPSSFIRAAASALEQTESPFEREVARRLIARGYRVHPQWEVGSFRIDLVIEGDDGRMVAVECDGDRYHGEERILEDIERQDILERLGWKFVRIRGGAFYRDQQATIDSVCVRLSELGIEPASQSAGEEAPEHAAVPGPAEEVRRHARALLEEWADEAGWSSPPTQGESDEREREAPTEEPPSSRGHESPPAQEVPPIPPSPIGPGTILTPPATSQEDGIRMDPPKGPPRETGRGNGTRDVAEIIIGGIDDWWRGKSEILSHPSVRSHRIRDDEWTAAISALLASGRVGRQGMARGTKYRRLDPNRSPEDQPPKRTETTKRQPKEGLGVQRVPKDPFLRALADADERFAQPFCSRCQKPARVFVGRKGPFLQCTDRNGCGATDSVGADVLQVLLDQHSAFLHCRETGCSGLLQCKNGPWGTYVKCTTCSKNESWQAFRERFRALAYSGGLETRGMRIPPTPLN